MDGTAVRAHGTQSEMAMVGLLTAKKKYYLLFPRSLGRNKCTWSKLIFIVRHGKGFVAFGVTLSIHYLLRGRSLN